MGIPKFFRYISERWPMILQLIEGTQIPEFDNLYLDMNSILHTCTHGNDDDISKRLTEEEVYARIFTYIDHLFLTIKPKQKFYMAIDGVAPRAKMNQQRARRFRTAMDAEMALQKAIKQGDELPRGEPFDSNAITPGTEFMAKLTQNLKYFIHDKITNDSKWSEIEIILSGHEVPGEGEHKIMDFIRNIRSQKDYDPNTRHCIYGLDADLIMLGLSVHDPHFALLREEVTFGRRNSSQNTPLERQNFYLLHLSLVREYMELEFQEIADDLQFEYDFDRILDDFILVMFVIGNDFLPNLPDLHLNKGAFPVLLQTFKESLLHSDGYINDHGHINFERLKVWLNYLSQFELMNFERNDIDVEWFNKQLENISLQGEKSRARRGKKLLLKQQKKLVGLIKPWLLHIMSNKQLLTDNDDEDSLMLQLPNTEDFNIENNLHFLKELAFELGLFIVHSKSKGTYSLKIDVDSINPSETEEEYQARIHDLRNTIKRYQNAILVEDQEELDTEKQIYDERFHRWKDQYYKEKVHFSIDDKEQLKDMTENYIEGLQWVMSYYYQGCPSWSWYYHYHYAPRISDLYMGLDVVINFQKGQPFTPFQQLMAVLPERSKNLIPAALRPLMYDEKSPILDFYPSQVGLDKNGKTADWEAVVLISFVDENRLVEAMKPLLAKLSPEEKIRNGRGTDLTFVYNPQVDEVYKSPLSGIFSDIEHDHCVERKFILKKLDASEIVYGLLPNAKHGKHLLAGFPSFETIPFAKTALEYNETMVFQQPSRQQSMVLYAENVYESTNRTLMEIAQQYMGEVVFTRWPYLRESRLISITDGTTFFENVLNHSHQNGSGPVSKKDFKLIKRPVNDHEKKNFKSLQTSMSRNYLKQKAMKIGPINAIIEVHPVSGLVRTANGAYKKSFSKYSEFYPLQLMVATVANHDQRFKERAPVPIEQEFPKDSQVIFLGDYAYGGKAVIDGYSSERRLKLTVERKSLKAEPTIGRQRADLDKRQVQYQPSFAVARNLHLKPLFLSKITSRFLIADENGKHVNIGIPIKFEGRHQKVLGYARKNPKGWEYSNFAISAIQQYRQTFPDFFSKLSMSNSNIPTIQEMYPDLTKDDLRKSLDKVKAWLKNITESFITVSIESDSLTKASIAAVEDEIIKYSQQQLKVEKKQLAKVPCDAVLDPKVSFSKLRSQKFDLGDRVVYIQDSGKVPLFSKGTVVGYTTLGLSLSIQVIFDDEIVAGNNFGGRLKTNRGLGLDASFLLNLTNRQFIYHSKASKRAGETRRQRKPTMEERQKQAAKKQEKVKEIRTERAHKLLTHIKKGESNGKAVPSEEKRKVPPANVDPTQDTDNIQPSTYAANHLYSAVLNQFIPGPEGVPAPAAPSGIMPQPNRNGNGVLPYNVAPMFTGQPPMFPPNGVMPQPPVTRPMLGGRPGMQPPYPTAQMHTNGNIPHLNVKGSKELKSFIKGGKNSAPKPKRSAAKKSESKPHSKGDH